MTPVILQGTNSQPLSFCCFPKICESRGPKVDLFCLMGSLDCTVKDNWCYMWFSMVHTFKYNYLIMFTVYEYVHVYIEIGNHIYISRAWYLYIYICIYMCVYFIYIHFILLWHTLTLQHLHIYFNYILLSSYSLKVDTQSTVDPNFLW